jgi:drug/metabolite transporter (DMT)-like permease
MSHAAPNDRPLDLAGIAGMILCCALWGGNAVAVKFAVPDLPPVGCAAIRFVIGLPVIALVCRWNGSPLWPRLSLSWLLGLHALLTVAQIGTFNWGTSLSQAGRSSIFINVHPLVVAPLAWAFLGERMGVRGWLGLVAAALGVAILLSERIHGTQGIAGDLIVLAAGAIFGVQTIVQKKTFPLIPPATLLFSQSVVALPLFFAFSAIFEGFSSYHFTAHSVWGVLYQGLAVSGVCFVTWMILLKHYPAGRLATIAFLTPLFGVGFGNLMRAEALTWPLLVGGTLVGFGIYLVASEKTQKALEPDLILPGEDAL